MLILSDKEVEDVLPAMWTLYNTSKERESENITIVKTNDINSLLQLSS